MKIFLSMAVLVLQLGCASAQKSKVLIITGGHSFDTVAFFNMFDTFDEIEYQSIVQPAANQLIARNYAAGFDLLVFYDMWKPISEEEINGYLGMTKAGKPLLFMHHALVSYPGWSGFQQIIGGRYFENHAKTVFPDSVLSNYKHDVWVHYQSVETNHPVTKGLSEFSLFDEVYGNYHVEENVKPLLLTNHPESSPVVAWENRFGASQIIYLQPGHDKNSFQNDTYRRLVRQAINYLLKSANQ